MLEYSFKTFGLIPEDPYAALMHLIQQGNSTSILGKEYNFSIQNKCQRVGTQRKTRKREKARAAQKHRD